MHEPKKVIQSIQGSLFWHLQHTDAPTQILMNYCEPQNYVNKYQKIKMFGMN